MKNNTLITCITTRSTLQYLLLATAFCSALVIARAIFYHQYHYLFLMWNLLLAWIPVIAIRFMGKPAGKKIAPEEIACIALCILFLPNAPYILTDLFHLRQDMHVPIWYDWLVLLASGWTGLLLGMWTLKRIQLWIEFRFSKRLAFYFVPVGLLLCAYGVYLGRYGRWNSWDIVAQPLELLADIFESFTRPRALGMTGLYTLFLTFAWWSFAPLMKNDIKPVQHG